MSDDLKLIFCTPLVIFLIILFFFAMEYLSQINTPILPIVDGSIINICRDIIYENASPL